MAYTSYKGPSVLDGNPIVALITGIDRPSANPKTGIMLHQWIVREDMDPLVASKTGADASICGNCAFRAKEGKERSCYVTLMHGPLQAYKGMLKSADPLQAKHLRGEIIRLGAYGDPAAIPLDYIEWMARHAAGVLGFTHQWKNCDQGLAKYCMASCETPEDHALAKEKGWRTFRVKLPEAPRLPGERPCPSAAEAGDNGVTCRKCMQCDGHNTGKSRDFVIDVHGTGRKHFMAALSRK